MRRPGSTVALCLALLWGEGVGLSRGLSAAESKVDFNRQILPILSDNCFACHGPDDHQRKAKLRLDVAEGPTSPASSGEPAVVPGDPARSALVQRITTSDEDDLMPPPKTGKTLSAAQVDLLKRWIQEGAHFEKHWAFTPPQRAAVPPVRQSSWARTDLDRFVLARLEQERLKPSPPADKATLARRATLDLTGLPPTPQEVDAFLADSSPGAYEALVDRLLDSPHYGEEMARAWMDAARYADSHGYHIDSERHMWAWRDWVIGAFNRNLPFDQFTREQLAGDLLPNATPEQRVASGYLRANMTTGEGGAIEEEYLAKYTFDRTETTGTIWLGLTLTCARCHTHKYDPVTQHEYYGLYGFFHQMDEPVMDGNKPNPDPFLKLPTTGQRERQRWLEDHVSRSETELNAPREDLDPAQTTWATPWRERLQSHLQPLTPVHAQSDRGASLSVGADGSVLAAASEPGADVHTVRFRLPGGRLGGLRVDAWPAPAMVPADSGTTNPGAFRLSGLEAEWTPPAKEGQPAEKQKLKFARAHAGSWEPDHDPGRVLDDKTETCWTPSVVGAAEGAALVAVLEAPVEIPDGSELHLRLRYEASTNHVVPVRVRVAAVAGAALVEALFPPKPKPWRVLGPLKSTDPATGLATVTEAERELDFGKGYPGVREEARWQDRGDLEDGRGHTLVSELHGVHGVYLLYRTITLPEARRVEFTLRADDQFKFWVDDALVARREAREKPGEGPVRAALDLAAGEHRFLIKVANLQGECRFAFTQDAGGLDRVSPEVAGVLLASRVPDEAKQTPVTHYFRRYQSAEWKAQADQLALWREENEAIERGIVTTLVAKERTTPRATHLLARGEYDKPGEVVAPGVPAVLPPFPAGAPTNRLGLAQWLTDPAHPLTARVTVNRFWQHYFGVGLVKTVEDFGVQGDRPSHPELLDWLATEFVRSGWDVKHLQRLIVTSATYRQASRLPPGMAARDPENRLLARGPRFRVDAEVVRDTALAVSGLLVESVGGRSVKPYEPPGLWEAVSYNNAQKYVQDRGDANYRRSLYTHWKRQSPPPGMLLFDAPTREYCVVRRPRTNTPLQALALLNDPQFVEASQAFARRVLREGGRRTDDRLRYAFRLATARHPSRSELKILRSAFEAQQTEYRNDPDAATQYLAVGAFAAGPGQDRSELAAWTALASLLLNLDETLTKS